MVPTDIRYDGAMSELGHSRRFDGRPATSGLPRSADIRRVRRHVSNVPVADAGRWTSGIKHSQA
jgi:hypothetical protein